jgi:hypothetical protein
LLTISAGCGTTGMIDSEQVTIDPNSSVVAFSVNTRELSEYAKPIRPKQLHVLYGAESVPIRLSGGKIGIQRVLLEVPAQTVFFSQFELVAGPRIYTRRYLIDDGQRIELTPGEITYLGRLEIEDIKFVTNDDGSPGKPTAIKLFFANELEDDQFAWEQQYKLFDNRVPNQQVVGNWAGGNYLTLWKKERTPMYTRDNRLRLGDIEHRPPPMSQPVYTGGPRTRPPNTSPH